LSNDTYRDQAHFAAVYQDMSDAEILKLASEGGLLPEADIALQAELKRRHLSAKDVSDMSLRQKEAELQIRVGNNPYNRGTGLRFRGFKILRDGNQRRDVVVTTRWIEFAYMPIIPIGSYSVVRSAGESRNPRVIGKEKLQWDQVLDGWMRAGVIALLWVGLIFAIVLWERFRK
jgi:hypothetical protein